MSLILFTLKQEHLSLLKNMKWSSYNNFVVSAENFEEDPSPFGGDDIYDDMDLILNGIPEDFDPLNTFEKRVYSPEQKAIFDKLLSELPTAIEIVLSRNSFEIGDYRARFHDRVWKKTQ